MNRGPSGIKPPWLYLQYAWPVCLFVAASAFAAATGRTLSAQPASDLRDLFQREEQFLMDSVATGNKNPWIDALDEDCIITNEEGEVLNKKTFLDQLTGLPPGLSGSIEIADLAVQRVSDFVVVRFRMNETETVFGQQLKTAYRSTDTFVLKNSTWKMIASHQSVITSDPPPQDVSRTNWPAFVGTYRLLPNGWILHVAIKDGELYSGRDPNHMKHLISIGPNVFTREGSLGEWIFCADEKQHATKIVEFRKFEPLIWTSVPITSRK